MLCFGGTRTFHRLACAVEDAGWELRDTIMWVYGSGFPKGQGCLKPAWEPVLLCRKPGPQVLPLGIDACRVGTDDSTVRKCNGVRNGSAMNCSQDGSLAKPGIYGSDAGRWPANVCHDGSEEVLEAFAAFGEKTTNQGTARSKHAAGMFGVETQLGRVLSHGNTGTAARFFYCAKASRAEREAGLEGMPSKQRDESRNADQPSMHDGAGNPYNRGVAPVLNSHPCVKPLALMSWLVKLACPPGGLVLDPFMGSGSTGVACVDAGRRFFGIERDESYFRIAEARIATAAKGEGK